MLNTQDNIMKASNRQEERSKRMSGKKEKQKSFGYYLKRDRFIYLLMLPGLIYFIVFKYIPMFGIVIAFEDYKPFFGIEGIFTSQWVGLKHFIKFFQSAYCLRLIKNTLLLSLYTLIWGFPLSIILALFINELKFNRFKKAVQTVSYLPHFLSAVIVCGIIRTMTGTDGGLINALITYFGGEPIYFLGETSWFRTIYTVSDVWQTIGWNSIVFIAAMAGIDKALYEAAKVDGAGVLKRMWHITLPGIMPVVTIMLIMRVGSILNVGYEKVLLLYSPQIYSVSDIISTYVYREGLINQNYSFATAVNLFTSVVSLVMVLGTNFVTKKMGQEGVW